MITQPGMIPPSQSVRMASSDSVFWRLSASSNVNNARRWPVGSCTETARPERMSRGTNSAVSTAPMAEVTPLTKYHSHPQSMCRECHQAEHTEHQEESQDSERFAAHWAGHWRQAEGDQEHSSQRQAIRLQSHHTWPQWSRSLSPDTRAETSRPSVQERKHAMFRDPFPPFFALLSAPFCEPVHPIRLPTRPPTRVCAIAHRRRHRCVRIHSLAYTRSHTRAHAHGLHTRAHVHVLAHTRPHPRAGIHAVAYTRLPIRARTPAAIRALACTLSPTRAHAPAYTPSHTRADAHLHALAHTCASMPSHPLPRIHALAYTRARTRACIHALTYTRPPTRAHTDALARTR